MAPRQRKDKSLAWLPPRVYQRDGGSFTWYPPAGGSKVIAKKNARPDQVWEAYNAAIADIRPNSLKYFWDQYQEGEQWRDHADATTLDNVQLRAAYLLMESDSQRIRARIIAPGDTAPLMTWTVADGWKEWRA